MPRVVGKTKQKLNNKSQGNSKLPNINEVQCKINETKAEVCGTFASEKLFRRNNTRDRVSETMGDFTTEGEGREFSRSFSSIVTLEVSYRRYPYLCDSVFLFSRTYGFVTGEHLPETYIEHINYFDYRFN